MKKVLSILLVSLGLVNTAIATVDAQSEVTIVTESVHEEDMYELMHAPAEFCLGILAPTLATAMTMPVEIKANYGCGGDSTYTSQVNALVCARISADEDSVQVNPKERFGNSLYLVDVKIDLTDCGEKAKSKNFIQATMDAVRKTFNRDSYQVRTIKLTN